MLGRKEERKDEGDRARANLAAAKDTKIKWKMQNGLSNGDSGYEFLMMMMMMMIETDSDD